MKKREKKRKKKVVSGRKVKKHGRKASNKPKDSKIRKIKLALQKTRRKKK